MVRLRAGVPVGRVVALVLLQAAGYAAILVLFQHDGATGLVDAVAGAPPVVLIPLAIPAVPATLLSIGLGGVLGAVGLPPASLPAIALAHGDVVFAASAVVVAVAAAWADERTSGPP